MSEKDIKLGGDAATKFASKKKVYDQASTYQSSDQVRAFYYQQQEEKAEAAKVNSNLPAGWEQRQKTRMAEASQHNVFSSKAQQMVPSATPASAQPSSSTTKSSSYIGPELSLLRLTTSSLNALAEALDHSQTSVPMEDRQAFANALKRAMGSLAKST